MVHMLIEESKHLAALRVDLSNAKLKAVWFFFYSAWLSRNWWVWFLRFLAKVTAVSSMVVLGRKLTY